MLLGTTMRNRHGGEDRNGRYWARTSDPQLVDTERSFARVRWCSVIAANPRFRLERVRTRSHYVHAGRAHRAHGFSTSLTLSAFSVETNAVNPPSAWREIDIG